MSLGDSQIKRLREEFPEAYAERTELIDLKARLHNALVWFGSSSHDKFTGRMAAIAMDFRDEPHPHGNPFIRVVEEMHKRYWANSWTHR